MDILTSVEPQLAIPVVGVVLCALLVYIFGFQKTQEPSFQHLALLQAAGKTRTSNTARQRNVPQVKNPSSKTTNKSTANGHVNLQASPKQNGSVKAPPKPKESNKENVRPQQQKAVKKEKVARDTAEDLESGDWIQAPSRKDKKSKKENAVPKSPEKSKPSLQSNNTNTVAEVVTEAVEEPQVEEVVVAKKEVEPELPKEPTPSTPKKAKENKKKSTPKVEKSSSPAEQESTAKSVKEQPKEAVVPSSPAKEVKEAPVPSKVEEPKSVDPKSNIAFDEMGDTWEEAKSRGTKKRTRARKD